LKTLSNKIIKNLIVFSLIFFTTICFINPIIFVKDTIAAGGTTYAAKGTPTIDGIKDSRYSETSCIELGSDKTAKTEVYALWDETYLYFYADVWDKTISTIDSTTFATTPWYSDSLEIFVDRTFSRSTDTNMPYGNIQMRVDCDNNVSGMVNGVIWAGKNNNFEGLVMSSSAKKWTDGSGYSLECKIPLSILAPNESTYSVEILQGDENKNNRAKVGYDLMLNNASNSVGSITRDGTYTWSSGVGAPAGWNTLILMDDVPEDLRSTNNEKVAILGNSNVCAGALGYMSTAVGFEHHTYYALDNNMDTYTQGIQEYWTFTVDFRYELEISKFVVKTHKDIYPTGFRIEYYNSTYDEWEIAWENNKNVGDVIQTCLISDQIGKYYITDDVIITRYIRFIPTGQIHGKQDFYSYSLNEFQAYTPNKIQTVSKVSNKTMPTSTDIPQSQGGIKNTVDSKEIVNNDLEKITVDMVSKDSYILTTILTVVSIVVIVACIAIYIILKMKKGDKNL